MELIKKYWWILAGVILFMFMGKKKKPRRRKRTKRNYRTLSGAAARMVYRRPMRGPLPGYRTYVNASRRRSVSRMRRRK